MARIEEIRVPDIGGAADVEVIEILVKPGDKINQEDPLVTLEGDKATMEVPSSETGTVKSVTVKVGDKVSEGSVIATMEVEGDSKAAEPVKKEEKAAAAPKPKKSSEAGSFEPAAPSGSIHASPAIRRLAHELGVDLRNVGGTGPKSRIVKQDVYAYVKRRMTGGGGGLEVASAPKIDFSKFGKIDIQPLNKIKKLTGANVHRSWVTVPHVTQFGDADITELEAHRKSNKAEAEKKGVKLTPLVFIMKAVVASMKAMPNFNSSLDDTGENLVLKKYFHIGIAVDTPNGLVVPVVRDVDKKDVYELAKELGDISTKARDKGLSTNDMAGSCFTISSLGGIGGTAFTPIVKSPDVAILGVSRSSYKPVYQDGEFVPRMMLPLSLSYDHRVIDGADGARFVVDLAKQLGDVKSLIK